MAEFIRSANELLAYNMTIQREDAVNFFGRELGSIDHLDPNLLSSADSLTVADFTEETYRFLVYLDVASRSNSGLEGAFDELTKSILEVTGIYERGTIVCTHRNIPLDICQCRRAALADVCLIHCKSMMILLVAQEDKMTSNTRDPEYQVIAQAIAAFQHNNRKRVDRGLPPLDIMTIPCITMVGTRPTFYKIPVTLELGNSVINPRNRHL